MHYFHQNVMQDKIYAQDNYQAIVVTIGQEEGDNWWCGLFPKSLLS